MDLDNLNFNFQYTKITNANNRKWTWIRSEILIL